MCHDIVIANNVVYNLKQNGIIITAYLDSLSKGYGFIVEGNTVSNIGGYGIRIINNDDVVVSGNTCVNNSYAGIEISGSVGATNGSTAVAVTGNTCAKNGWQGIAFVRSQYCTCTANICNNNIADGIKVQDGGYAPYCTDIVISGNICFDDQTPKTQDYGIHTADSSDNITIIGNNFRGNLLGGISYVGSNNYIRNNRGYVTENSGTVSLSVPFATAGIERISVSYTFPTAFAVTPKVVLATTNTTDVSIIGYTAISTTSMTWVFSDNVGVDKTAAVGVEVRWHGEA
jgi:parallel beta-helix repeat protein